MPIDNMLAAKTNLSRLVEQIETGAEPEVIIPRNGKPAARLVPMETVQTSERPLGLVAGPYETCSQKEFDETNEVIAAMFSGET